MSLIIQVVTKSYRLLKCYDEKDYKLAIKFAKKNRALLQWGLTDLTPTWENEQPNHPTVGK